MEPRCNHLGNLDGLDAIRAGLMASMEPRCNHLGNAGGADASA